jgi:hypothetical protein
MAYNPRMRCCGATLAMLGACFWNSFELPESVLRIEVDEPNPLAVDSMTTLKVVNTNCGFFSGPDTTCPARAEELLEHRLAPAAFFEVTRTGTQFEVAALEHGVARFSVDVSSGEQRELSYNLVARTIETVSLTTLCTSPALMFTGGRVAFDYQLRHGSELLNGRIMPFVIVGAELRPPDKLGGPWLELPATPSTVTITSPYDSSFAHHIDVIERASIDGVAITDQGHALVVGGQIPLRADLLVGARATCHESLPITTTISTPERCALHPGYGSASDSIVVMGLSAGECTVHVTLNGTAISATKSFPVML